MLNALAFIDDIDTHQAGDKPKNGVDEGYVCILPKDKQERPDFKALVKPDDDSFFDKKIPNYSIRTKNYQKFLNSMQK